MKFKIINRASIALALSLLVFFTGCEKWIDPSINEDPNNPTEVAMDLLIPSVIVNMAYDQGGNDAVRTLGIWTQQFDGVDRQSYAEATFVYTPADCNNLWNATYPNMLDIKDIIEKASAKNDDGKTLSPRTRGLAKVLLAEHLAFATNLWGAIPYTEALQGDGNLNPKLDSQQEIYTAIQTLLTEAIADLNNTEGLIGIPAKGDMIYAGEAKSWLVTAYALKARYSLMLSKKNGATALADAITFANLALDNMAGTRFLTKNGFVASVFVNSPSGANPIYQFMNQRSGDLVMGARLMEFLADNTDPRITRYGDGSGGGTGSVATTQTPGVDLPGPYVAAINAPVRFMNLSELYFILAEATFASDAAAAIDFAELGIRQSLKEAGVTTNAGFDAYISGLSTLEDILMEKWVANYGTVQVFNDWRRTGVPVLEVPVNAVNNAHPRRYPYPQEEVTYNSNVSTVSIFSRVWWDE